MVALRTEAENNECRSIKHNRVAQPPPAVQSPLKRRTTNDRRPFSIYRPQGMPDEPLPFIRKDALPDTVDYRDTGCELAPSCLNCPLPRCQYEDEPAEVRAWLIAARDREIVLLRQRYHAPVSALARTYRLTRRTIFRILREQREVRGGKREE